MDEPTVQIAGRTIARDGPPFVIAEIGVNHDGQMSIAGRLIDAAAEARADAVKFQLFSARLLLAREAALVDYQKSSAPSAAALLTPLELTPEQIAALIAHAHDRGLAALVTPFSVPLVPAAARAGADALKIASPDLVNRPLVEAAVATDLPLVVSTGAAWLDEIAQTLSWLGPARRRTILLHCVSSYPTPEDGATLAAIRVMRTEWPDLAVGYSDHTTHTITGGLAVSSGAVVLEKHLTLDRARRGPDHAASLDPADFARYVELARTAHRMRGPFAKAVLDIEQSVREQTRQSVALAVDVPRGVALRAEHLTVMRPGTGIPAAGLADVVGRWTVRALKAHTLLQLADLGDPENLAPEAQPG